MAMIDNEDNISLRPLSLRPGGAGNPFAQFSKGAGIGIRSKAKDDAWEDLPARKPEERIRYSKAFLESLREAFTSLPTNVPTYLPCFTTGERSVYMFNRTFQQASTSSPADERDWTARKAQFPTQPMAPGAGPVAPQQLAHVSKLNKASDQGREAYRPMGLGNSKTNQAGDDEKAVRTIKGILNKLTPDNFERLQSQLVSLVSSAEILRQTISLVFEKAVAEPTFCALYAQLGEKLSNELVDFPPAEGEDKPMTFRRILLNTCQDEFEGASDLRKKTQDTKEEDREAHEKAVKNRTLGNVRLISELYKKGLVMEKIMHACLRELLETDNEADTPVEDNVEAACEVLTLAGKKLSESKKFAKHLPAYINRLERFCSNKALPSRIRFMIRDILDMKDNGWVPRRERFTAKKIDEIRTEAQKDLGITVRMPQSRPTPQPKGFIQQNEEAELFPAPQKFSKEDDWKAVSKKFNRMGAASSATPSNTSAPASGASSPPDKTESRSVSSKKLTPEEREKRSKMLFSEYLSSADKAEAVTCAREILSPEGTKQMIDVGVQEMLASIKERDQLMLAKLLVILCKEKVYTADDLISGVKLTTDQLDDLSLDVPKAPNVCGNLIGLAVTEDVFTIDVLPAVCKSILSGEIRRTLSKVALLAVSSAIGSDALQRRCQDKGLKASEFLTPTPDFDPPGLPSVEEFLKAADLSMVPL